MMVFRTFDRMSYALIMEATDDISVLDTVRNPLDAQLSDRSSAAGRARHGDRRLARRCCTPRAPGDARWLAALKRCGSAERLLARSPRSRCARGLREDSVDKLKSPRRRVLERCERAGSAGAPIAS